MRNQTVMLAVFAAAMTTVPQFAAAKQITFGTSAVATLRICGNAGANDPCQFTRPRGGFASVGGAGQAAAYVEKTGTGATQTAGSFAFGQAEFNSDNFPVLHALSLAEGNARMNGSGEAYYAFTWNGSDGKALSLTTSLEILASRASPAGNSVTAEGAGEGLAGGSAYVNRLSIFDASYFARNFFNQGGAFTGGFLSKDCASAGGGMLGDVSLSGLGSGSAISASGTTSECSEGSLHLNRGQGFVVASNLSLFTNRGGFLDASHTARVGFDPNLSAEDVQELKAGLVLGAAAAVPEPATWAMMIGGFGMAGAMLRRRRTVAA